MKSLYLTAILILFGLYSVTAQSITISLGEEPVGPSGAGASFPVESGVLSVSGNQIALGEKEFYRPQSWSVSPDSRKISFLVREDGFIYKLFDSDGSPYFEKELEFFDIRDETAKNYQFDDGTSVLRDNVANFSFLSSEGEQLFSISNSSQSTEGERESELASDKYGKTVVLYNPVINYGNTTGSRASVISKKRELSTFFRDREREIRFVEVTSGGSYITIIVTPAPGSNAFSALIFDRYGNKLSEIATEEELKGIELSENADFATLYSSGRMQVYRTGNGERVASASSRSSVLHATYDPEENLIIALGGTLNGLRITNPSITVVNVGQRQISSEEIDGTLYALKGEEIRLIKEGNQQYGIQNLNRSVRINTSF